MKIYFKSIPGLDSSIIWDYDDVLNRATYTPPLNAPKLGKIGVFEMPAGMEMEETQFVINDVRNFAKNHPYQVVDTSPQLKKSRPSPLKLNIFAENPTYPFALVAEEKDSTSTNLSSTTADNGFFAQPKHSSSSSHSSPEPLLSRSKPRLTASSMKSRTRQSLKEPDYPASLRLTDLINSEFNLSSCGETIAYRSLYHKKGAEKPRKATFLRDNWYFHEAIEMPLQHYKLKVELLDSIEALLELFNISYQEFCSQAKPTDETRKGITDYFCQAIIQTMANGEFKKAPTEFQAEVNKGNETLFKGSQEACALFNAQALELRLQALQLNWQALINNNLTINQSTACSLKLPTQDALHNFKVFLTGDTQTEFQEKIPVTLKMMQNKLFELVIFEQKQAAAIQLYRSSVKKKEEPFTGYSSLSILINKLFASHLKPLPFDMHLTIQKELVNKILRDVITKLALNPELRQDMYSPYVAKVTIYSTELYIDDEQLKKIQEGMESIPFDKRIKKKLPKLHSGSLSEINTTIEEIVPQISQIIYDNIYSQLEECVRSSQLVLGM